MNDTERAQYENEIEVGGQYRLSWQLVSKFVEQKEQQLFDAFKSTPSSNTSGLVDIRMQHNALVGLKQEFMTHIETANLAAKSIAEEEKKNG